MNDPSPPSDGATYYIEDTIQLIGTDFFPNETYKIAILDADNRSATINGKIVDFYSNDTVYRQTITADPSGNVNVSVYLRSWHPDYGPGELHARGIWTVYIYYHAYNWEGMGYFEWIPFETFTVVNPPLRLTVASPLNGETYYTGGQFTGSLNLQVSANTQLANKEIDTWWYSIDGGPNTTFNPNITFNNLNLGEHTVIVYANDTEGNISQKQSTFELWYTPTDNDGDKQQRGLDCKDNNYYIYNSAPQIPFDGLTNDCRLGGQDGTLYDMNDPSPPSNGATYYIEDTIQLIGTDFFPNETYKIQISDADNRTIVNSGKITSIYSNDTVYHQTITADPSGNINVSVYLRSWHPDYGPGELHARGIWTVYIYYHAYNWEGPGYFEWIPFETFTVVNPPLRLTVASPLNGETYYTGGQFTGSVNLQVSDNTQLANKEIDTWWYSIDGAANQTFEPNTTIPNLNLGEHTIIVYANDTEGNISQKQSTFELWYTTADPDGDGQEPPEDCDATNYYRFTGAVNIPYDGVWNDCDIRGGDSWLKDINDTNSPSNNATYYLGETMTIIGDGFKQNYNLKIIIADAENRTENPDPDPNKIIFINTYDRVWLNFITTNATGGFSQSITLINNTDHGLGVYTIYLWFESSIGGIGNREWIPVDTFTVVENHAPNATIQNITGYENTNITFNLPATDSDGDNLTYSSDNPNITWNGTHLNYEADYDDVIHPNLTKTITVNITADDTRLNYTQEVNITIIDVNRLPVLAPIGSRFINENELISFNLNATDLESDPLTFDAQPLPIGATLTANTFSWTPDPAQAGIHSINFSVSDGIDTVNESVQITVADIANYINGTVLDGSTGIAGAVVTTDTGVSTTADGAGFYSLLLDVGTYNLTATKDPQYYSNSSVVVDLTSGSGVQDIELTKKPTGTINGTITNASP